MAYYGKTYITFSVKKRRNIRETVLYLYNGQQRQIYSSRDRFTAIRECLPRAGYGDFAKNIRFT